MFTSTLNGVKTQIDIQNLELETVFGYSPILNVNSSVGCMHCDENGNLVGLDGVFLEILTREGVKYTIANSPFTKTINFQAQTGDAYFAGPWNETSKKLVNLFFSKLPEGATVNLNDTQKKLTRNLDGTITLL